MDERDARSIGARAWLPWALGGIAVAALVRLAVELAPNWYRLFGPYLLLDLSIVAGVAGALVPFALAAAVLVGAPRWSTGAGWLSAGAVILVVGGLLESVQEVILVPGAFGLDGSTMALLAWLPWVSVAGLLLWVVTTACLALGIRRGRRSRSGSSAPRRRGFEIAVVLLGIASIAAVAWPALLIDRSQPSWLLQIIVYVVALGARHLALVVLALVALRSAPAEGAVPELLIAGGSLMALIGMSVGWVLPYVLPLGPGTPAAVFLIPGIAVVIGLLGVALGFIFDPPSSRVGELTTRTA